jgi:hypothetical protein
VFCGILAAGLFIITTQRQQAGKLTVTTSRKKQYLLRILVLAKTLGLGQPSKIVALGVKFWNT